MSAVTYLDRPVRRKISFASKTEGQPDKSYIVEMSTNGFRVKQVGGRGKGAWAVFTWRELLLKIFLHEAQRMKA